MQKNVNWLKALQYCSKSEKEHLLKAAKPQSINAVCDYIHNILKGNIDLNQEEKSRLKAKKAILRKLADRRTKVPERKKLLVQHGAGFLNSILGPVLGALGNIFLQICMVKSMLLSVKKNMKI